MQLFRIQDHAIQFKDEASMRLFIEQFSAQVDKHGVAVLVAGGQPLGYVVSPRLMNDMALQLVAAKAVQKYTVPPPAPPNPPIM